MAQAGQAMVTRARILAGIGKLARLEAGAGLALMVAAVTAVALPPVFAAEPQFAALETQLRCLSEQGKIPGAVVLVARNGKLIEQSQVGFQDIATRVPMTRDTLFRLYSMSKP